MKKEPAQILKTIGQLRLERDFLQNCFRATVRPISNLHQANEAFNVSLFFYKKVRYQRPLNLEIKLSTIGNCGEDIIILSTTILLRDNGWVYILCPISVRIPAGSKKLRLSDGGASPGLEDSGRRCGSDRSEPWLLVLEAENAGIIFIIPKGALDRI